MNSGHPLYIGLMWRSCRKCLCWKLKACGWCGQQLLLLLQTKYKGQWDLFTRGDSTSFLALLSCLYNTTVNLKELCSGVGSSFLPWCISLLHLLWTLSIFKCKCRSLINKAFALSAKSALYVIVSDKEIKIAQQEKRSESTGNGPET